MLKEGSKPTEPVCITRQQLLMDSLLCARPYAVAIMWFAFLPNFELLC